MPRAGLDDGFGHLGLAEICRWVMEKQGVRYERDFEIAGWCVDSVRW